MNRDWNAFLETIVELIALQQPRHRVFGTQLDDVDECERRQPFAVESDFGLNRIQNLKNLCLIRFGVPIDLLARHGRTRRIAAGGIADEPRVVADQENYGVAEILKVLHLAEQHGVPQMQGGRSGIEAPFDAQLNATLTGLNQALA